MNSTLEIVELAEQESVEDDSIIHQYCNTCYPGIDEEVSLCGKDLSNDAYLAIWDESDVCSMCVMVYETSPVNAAGEKLCPKGHVLYL